MPSSLVFQITILLSVYHAIAIGISPHFQRIVGPQARDVGPKEQPVDARVLAERPTSRETAGLSVQSASDSGFFTIPKLKNGQLSDWSDLPLGWFEQPLDHFNDSNTHTFKQRFWVNSRHYKARKGAPVFVLDGGNANAMDSLPVLDTGIINILAKATNGIGVLLEHRYYGESVPVENFTTDSLRWLTNEQAAADSANFISQVKFEDITEDLAAPNSPWIYYGGSYAGARAAHMRVLYPELVYGAIASGAPTHATLENWQYNEVVRQAANTRCSEYLANATEVIDDILLNGRSKRRFKDLFGLADLRRDADFASFITGPLSRWQDKSWNPAIGPNELELFCIRLNTPYGNVTEDMANSLPFGHPKRLIEVKDGLLLDFSIVNWANYIREDPTVQACLKENGETNDCFTTYSDEAYQDANITRIDRPWRFQMCTQWGLFIISPPDPHHPRIVSRTIDLEYKMRICRKSFPHGEHYRVPIVPNINPINRLGGFNIAADRLAFIDGEFDPWRPRTPHSDDAMTRPDTILRPFKLIPGGVHNWDMSGFENISDEPSEIHQIHKEIIGFVGEWLENWRLTSRAPR